MTEQDKSFKYDVFISYSRKNEEFASQLERALERYKPETDLKVPQRFVEAFRDKEDFTGGNYHKSLLKNLSDSSKLLLICSPEARKSKFVNDEIKEFVNVRGADHIIPVLFSGVPNNEAKPEQEDEKAFPEELCKVMEMPLAVNYLGFDTKKDKINKDIFISSWYSILADIYELSRSEMEQREKRRRSRQRRITVSVLSGSFAILSVLLIFALVSRSQALTAREAEQSQREIAEAARKEAESALYRETIAKDSETKAKEFAETKRREAETAAENERIAAENERIAKDQAEERRRQAEKATENERVAKIQAEERRKEAEIETKRANLQAEIANERGRLALSRQLSAQANSTRNQDERFLPLSLLLGVEGLEKYPTWEADYSVRKSLDLLPRLTMTIPHSERLESVSVNKNGDYVVTASGDTYARGGQIKVWHLDNSRSTEILEYDAPGPALFNPENNSLAVGSRSGKLDIREVPSGQLLASFPHEVNLIKPVAFSPDGHLIAVVAQQLNGAQLSNDSIRIWSLTQNKQVAKIKSQTTASLLKLNFLDNQRLAADDGELWDAATGKSLSDSSLESAYSKVYSPNRKYLVRMKSPAVVEVVEVASDKVLLEIKNESIERSYFSPNDKFLVLSDLNYNAHIWKIDDSAGADKIQKIKKIERITGAGTRVEFSHNSEYVSFTSGITTVCELKSGRIMSKIFHPNSTYNVLFTPDDKSLIALNEDAARFWNVTGGQAVATFANPTEGVLTVSEDGKKIAATSYNEARIWTLHNNELQILAQKREILSVALDPKDNETAATGTNAEIATGEPNGIWFWNSGNKKLFKQMEGHVTSLRYSSKGNYLAAGVIDSGWISVQDFGIWLWDAQSKKELWHNNFDSMIQDISFSPDEKYIAVVGGSSSRIFEVKTGKVVYQTQYYHKVKYSRDGEFIAFSREREILVYKLKQSLPVSDPVRISQEQNIVDLDFGATSDYLATVSGDNTTRVWYLKSSKAVKGPREISRIEERSPHGIAFSRDGNYLITKSSGQINLWIWKSCDLLAEAKQHILSPLTKDERQQYIGELDFSSSRTEPSQIECKKR